MFPTPVTSSTSAPSVTASGAVTATSAAADKNMFLQLLVAQLKNQDPSAPMDSTAFVTQLAQFQQLESTVNMGQDITGIRTDADQLLATQNAAGTTAAGTTGTTKTTTP
jgi:flagellar basal-body rod modification protein FlgD